MGLVRYFTKKPAEPTKIVSKLLRKIVAEEGLEPPTRGL